MRYLLVVLLAGCTASNWMKDGATTAELDRDYDECRVVARPDPALAAIAGAFGAVGVFVGTTAIDGRIRTCLQARGWTVGPDDAKLAEAAPTPGSPAATTAAVPVRTADTETPAARRLLELKSLSDQGLITKEEYEERRQAVLRGL